LVHEADYRAVTAAIFRGDKITGRKFHPVQKSGLGFQTAAF